MARTAQQIANDLWDVAKQIAALQDRQKQLKSEWQKAEAAETRKRIEDEIRNG